MKKNVIIIFFLMWFPVMCFGKKTKEIELTISYSVKTTGATEKIRLVTLIPGDVNGRQSVHRITFSVEPDTVYTIGENQYAEFILLNPISDLVEIYAELKLSRSDYRTLSRLNSDIILPEKEMERYLRSELFIEYEHPEFINFAASLKGKNRLSTVRNIYSFLKPDIRQVRKLRTTRQGVFTLSKLLSGFGKFPNLMVALCRANGIPSRTVYGLKSNGGEDPKREWAEVYFEHHGWISFEPTPGNHADFRKMDNEYIYLCPSGRDEELMAEYYRYRYWYWGDSPEINENYNIVEKK